MIPCPDETRHISQESPYLEAIFDFRMRVTYIIDCVPGMIQRSIEVAQDESGITFTLIKCFSYENPIFDIIIIRRTIDSKRVYNKVKQGCAIVQFCYDVIKDSKTFSD